MSSLDNNSDAYRAYCYTCLLQPSLRLLPPTHPPTPSPPQPAAGTALLCCPLSPHTHPASASPLPDPLLPHSPPPRRPPALENAVSVVLLSLSMVMAGSGHLPTFRLIQLLSRRAAPPLRPASQAAAQGPDAPPPCPITAGQWVGGWVWRWVGGWVWRFWGGAEGRGRLSDCVCVWGGGALMPLSAQLLTQLLTGNS